MIGQTIGHYKIMEELGRGGMGIVYKAHDTRLDRDVALKFLPHDLSSTEEEKARFLQEARAAATLNHAHICTIYAIEENAGQQFIAMEYIDGVTLRKKIGASHGLKLDDVVGLGVQIGDALHEAHAKGIVHRDVKAENIMVSQRQQAKVMDFGLAKLKGSLKLTKTSSTVGTLAYMAPEQIQGGEVDARSDIFSFGVVIFEMLTGQTPFRGEHEAAMMYSILNEEPEPVSKFLPDASPELLHILNRALEKDPEDRYQSVHDMVIDLRRLKKDSTRVSRQVPGVEKKPQTDATISEQQSPAGRKKVIMFGAAALVLIALGVGAVMLGFLGESESEERLTVAVSDFVNETSEPELDGLSGMLITSMEQSRRLIVMTRARMFDVLKQQGKDHVDRIDEALGREIAQAAGVDALVSASIRKFGRLYTIDLKVLDPKKDEYLFTAKEQGEGQESIPQMLDLLSEKTRIGLKEKAEEVRELQKSVAAVTTSNLEAYQHFFRGEELINRLKFLEAEEELRKAVALDTSFGLAYYRLAYAIAWFGEGGTREYIARAMRHVDRIPEREQYLLRAEDARERAGMEGALDVLKEMEKHYPEDKEMLYGIGDYTYHISDLDNALQYFTRVLAIDPKFERALQHLAWTYRDLGRYDQMLETAKKYVGVSGSGDAYATMGSAYARLGRYQEGLETLTKAQQLFPDSWEITSALAWLSFDSGDLETADRESQKLISGNPSGFVKRRGYEIQSDLLIYQGKLKRARSAVDESLAISLQLGDTTDAGSLLANKASWALYFENDLDRAWTELQQAMEFPRYSASSNARSWLGYFSILRGDMVTAENIIPKSPDWIRSVLFSFGSLRKGDCASGELIHTNDSLWRVIPEGFRQQILYDLAGCYLTNASYQKALDVLHKLQSTKRRSESVGSYPRSFYLEGKAYEGLGERGRAREAYETFLGMWKDADKTIPDYQDAVTRLAKLKGNA